MQVSRNLEKLFKKIENSENSDIINSILNSDSESYQFIDCSDKHDFISFYGKGKPVLYTLDNPTTTDSSHNVYKTALLSIKKEDKDKITTRYNRAHSYRILKEYPGFDNFITQYRVIHMENTVDGTQILNLQPFNERKNMSMTSGENMSIIKIGRFLKTILPSLKDSRVEKFVNSFKAQNLFNDNMSSYFKVVDGDDIKFWYDGENYAADCGTLSNSCMRYKNCQNYFDIYINNNVKMLILTDLNNKLIGRALLWETYDGKYMDRVYSQDHVIEVFDKWADANDYKLTYSKNEYQKLKVDLKLNLSKKIPYLDTFRFMTLKKYDVDADADVDTYADVYREYTLSARDPRERIFILNQTNGSYND